MAKKKKCILSRKEFERSVGILTDDATLTIAKLVDWQSLSRYSCFADLHDDKGEVIRTYRVSVKRVK